MTEFNANDAAFSKAVYVSGLIHKVREKMPLTNEEQKVLEDWIGSAPGNKELFDSLLDRVRVAGELEALLQYNEDYAVSTVFNAIGYEPAPVVPLWRKIVQGSVAAALVLLLAGMTWRYFARRNAVEQEGAPPVAAGAAHQENNKAVLTLANGKTVVLDSIPAQLPEMQGAANIEQRKDGLVYTARGKDAVAYNTLTVPKGGQYHVVLADHSEVWLNAASSMTYPTTFDGAARPVTITGEAWFKVATDKEKPFMVTARGMKVEVLGTEFDVMAYSDEDAIRTTLLSGAIRASIGGKPAQQLLLKPGEQAVLGNRTGELREEKPNLDAVTGWRFGEFRCYETNLTAIMRQIARWYDVTIEYRGPVDNIHFSGQLSKKERVEDLLDILADTRRVHFEIINNKTIMVIPGRR